MTGGRAAIADLNKPYTLDEPARIAGDGSGGGYVVMLRDRTTGRALPICWSDGDEERHSTQAQKVTFVTAMIKNAIATMDDLLDGTLEATAE